MVHLRARRASVLVYQRVAPGVGHSQVLHAATLWPGLSEWSCWQQHCLPCSTVSCTPSCRVRSQSAESAAHGMQAGTQTASLAAFCQAKCLLVGTLAPGAGHSQEPLSVCWVLRVCALQGGQQAASLAAVCQARCLLVVILPPGARHTQEQLDRLAAALEPPLKQVAAAASEHFAAQRQGHISGLRWALVLTS